jgi:hypothetical protein
LLTVPYPNTRRAGPQWAAHVSMKSTYQTLAGPMLRTEHCTVAFLNTMGGSIWPCFFQLDIVSHLLSKPTGLALLPHAAEPVNMTAFS